MKKIDWQSVSRTLYEAMDDLKPVLEYVNDAAAVRFLDAMDVYEKAKTNFHSSTTSYTASPPRSQNTKDHKTPKGKNANKNRSH